MSDIKDLEQKLTELAKSFQDPSVCNDSQKIQQLSHEYAKTKEEIEKIKKRGDKNIIVEIRSGVGGDEAELFTASLFKMYSKYAQGQGWKVYPMTEVGDT